MTTIMPQSEQTRKAIAWISETKESNPEKSLQSLREEAAMRFNLGPKDECFLKRFYEESKK